MSLLKITVIAILALSACSVGQEKSAGKAKVTPQTMLTFDVKFAPVPERETPFVQGDDTALFARGCDDHGNPYVQVQKDFPPHSSQVLLFGDSGIVTFETKKISDIVEPKWIADFTSDSELYMLIEGDTHTKELRRNVEGLGDVVSWETTGEPHYYIAKFDSDGSYKGALKLDLPLRPMRISGFASGNFLVAGLDERHALRIALLDSSGQMFRFVEFPKEKDGKWEEKEKSVSHSVENATPEIVAYWLALEASFLPYHGNVLYVRGNTGAPIYEINAAGDPDPVKIKSPDDYSVEHLLPSDRNWFVVSTSGEGRHIKSMVEELNPSTGEPLARYLVEGAGRTKTIESGQSDAACFHDGVFIAVRHQDGKLMLLVGTPTPAVEAGALAIK